MDESAASESPVSIHPLALVSMSDHVLRANDPGNQSNRIVGFIFGIQHALRVEIFTTVEALVRNSAGGVSLDQAFLMTQVKLATTVFPTHQLLGMYVANQGTIDHIDRLLYGQVAQQTEAPLLLHMDLSSMRAGAPLRELPVNVFVASGPAGAQLSPGTSSSHADDSSMTGASGNAQSSASLGLVSLAFKIEASEPERIAIDYITTAAIAAGSVPPAGADASVASNPLLVSLRSTGSALDFLGVRVEVLLAFVQAVADGHVPFNGKTRAILRDIASLVGRLPIDVPVPPGASNARVTDAADSALVSLAGALTEAVAIMAVTAEKCALVDRENARPMGGIAQGHMRSAMVERLSGHAKERDRKGHRIGGMGAAV